MLLEEKQVPYVVKKVNMNCYGGNKPAEFLKVQPFGTLPAAVIDGVAVQSSDAIIAELLSRPGSSREIDAELDSSDDVQFQELVTLSNTLFNVWLRWLGMFGTRGEEGELEYVLQHVEAALSNSGHGAYFLGTRFSIVDIMFVPYLERVAASLAYAKGIDMRDGVTYPAIHKWFIAVESRQSYQNSKVDYYTHAHNVPASLGAFPLKTSGERFRNDIDGDSWKLPLRQSLIEPAWDWISSDEAYREAAERLIQNSDNVVRFAARGAGLPGFPAAAAELADPNAIPAQAWVPCVDMLLRHTAMLLLTGSCRDSSIDSCVTDRATALAAATETILSIPAHARGTAATCLQYLQQRIGVPRDMSLPAAARVRAELDGLIELLQA